MWIVCVIVVLFYCESFFIVNRLCNCDFVNCLCNCGFIMNRLCNCAFIVICFCGIVILLRIVWIIEDPQENAEKAHPDQTKKSSRNSWMGWKAFFCPGPSVAGEPLPLPRSLFLPREDCSLPIAYRRFVRDLLSYWIIHPFYISYKVTIEYCCTFRSDWSWSFLTNSINGN